MDTVIEKAFGQTGTGADTEPLSSNLLRIVICPAEFELMSKVMRGEPAEATYIIQGYIAKGLAARDHKLTFITPSYPDQFICTNDLLSPQVAPQTWSGSLWFRLARKVTWTVQKWLGVPYLSLFSNYHLFDVCLQCLPGHDIVYERNGLYRYGLAMACKRLGLPYVLYFEADDIMELDLIGQPVTGLLRWRAKKAMQYNLDAADCIISVSEPGKTHLINKWGVPAEKIVVFPNVADVRRFRPDPEKSSTVRASLGLADQPVVIFVGNFYKWHDVTTLLDAFAQTLEVYPAARLLLVGDGLRRPAMAKKTTDLGIDQAVQFTGMVPHDDVPGLMAAADIAVVPYPPMETDLWLSPLKLFEYMAAGKAVVASEVGQLTKVIKDNHNGLLVPPGDVPAMATALQQLIGNPVLRLKLGRQAREDAVQKHSWDHYLSHLEQVFKSVLNGRHIDRI